MSANSKNYLVLSIITELVSAKREMKLLIAVLFFYLLIALFIDFSSFTKSYNKNEISNAQDRLIINSVLEGRTFSG